MAPFFQFNPAQYPVPPLRHSITAHSVFGSEKPATMPASGNNEKVGAPATPTIAGNRPEPFGFPVTSGSPELLSNEDRISKLEASLMMIHEIHQRESALMRAEIEALKAQTLKTSLNKNAPAFVPGPTPATPTTPSEFQKPTWLSLSLPNPAFSSPATPSPTFPSADSQPQQGQIYCLSQQVNVLSATMSQLLSTLLTSPGPVTISSNPPLSPNTSAPSLLPPPNGRAPTRSASGPVTSPGLESNHSHNLHPNPFNGPGRVPHRHPGNLTLRPNSEHPKNISSEPQFVITPTTAQQESRRCGILSPVVCQTPVHGSAPLSPLPYETSGNGSAPTNSLAGKWEQLGITGDVLRALVRFGIGPPTKTQQKSIPCMLLGKDLVSQSNPIQERIQSYIIPALQLISNEMNALPGPTLNTSVKVLVITATLDEAAQAHRLASGIAALLPNPPKVFHCGTSDANAEFQSHQPTSHHLQPHLLIGTPSKLLDPVSGLRGFTFEPQSFICVILDEMDQLLARNLSEMVTSLMAFLPSNSPQPSAAMESAASISSSPKSKSDSSAGSPPSGFILPDKWNSGSRKNSLAFSPPSSAPNNTKRGSLHGRQTCIFSCTVPQDVLSYARTLNLRARVLVRREENNSSGNSNSVTSNLAAVNSPFDMTDHRGSLSIASPVGLTASPGQYLGLNPQQLIRQLNQFYLSVLPSPNGHGSVRERRIESLMDLLGAHKTFEPNSPRLVLIYCNSVDSVEAVNQSLHQRGIDSLALHQDMGPAARHSLLNKFGRGSRTPFEPIGNNPVSSTKAWVVYDALAKSLTDMTTDKPSLVVNFELPRAAEDYIHRAACLVATENPNVSKKTSLLGAGALINLVHGSNEHDMIKSVEGFYRCKIQELSSSIIKDSAF